MAKRSKPEESEATPAVEEQPLEELGTDTLPKVLHVRCINSSQISAMGTSLDAVKNGLALNLVEQGVRVDWEPPNPPAGAPKRRRFIIPFSNIAHIETEYVED